MEKRALIAVVISLVILLVYQEVILKRLYSPQAHPERSEPQPVAAPPAAPEIPAPPVEADVPPEAPAPGAEGRDLKIDTDLYRAVVTAAGGRLKSFQLKRYQTTVATDSPPQEMVLASGGSYPLGVQLRGKESVSDGAVSYVADQDRLDLDAGSEGSLTLKGSLGDTTIRKTFTFRGGTYLVGLDVEIAGASAFSELGIAWDTQRGEAPHTGETQLYDYVSVLQGKKLLHEQFNDLADGKIIENDVRWCGYDGRHFLAAMVPSDGETTRLWLKQRDTRLETMLLIPRRDGELNAKLDVYIGPKDLDALESLGHSLSRAVDLGYFSFIAIPLLHALKLSYRATGNYGIDIILLTVVIKVLFTPLTQRSFKSMKAMQKLQPQMAKLRERYKDSPEQMNKEIMELYRRHKVNPLGGCLPMVLQIPVFIGLYNALSHAVELRHAPFFLWINDLSAPDRLGTLAIPFVTPPGIPVLTLLMGVSMFVQQWMTPTTGDPSQQRIMMIMPIMFTFMFVSFPAGLTLYWLVNNILTIGQQYAIIRKER